MCPEQNLPISTAPVCKSFLSPRMPYRTRANAGFAISNLRLDRLVALTFLALLLTSGAVFADEAGGIAGADKAATNAGIAPPANAQS